MLDAADLVMMRATADLTRNTQAQILRVVRTPDGFGGVSEAWSVLSSPMCRLVPYVRLDYEQIMEERVTLQNRFLIYFTAGTDVTERDRISALGHTFEVSSVQQPGTFEVERATLCYEVH